MTAALIVGVIVIVVALLGAAIHDHLDTPERRVNQALAELRAVKMESEIAVESAKNELRINRRRVEQGLVDDIRRARGKRDR